MNNLPLMTFPPSIGAGFAGFCAPIWYFWHHFLGNPSLTGYDWQGYRSRCWPRQTVPQPRQLSKTRPDAASLRPMGDFIIQKRWKDMYWKDIISISSLKQDSLFDWSGNFKYLIVWLRFDLRKHWLNSTLYICFFCIRSGHLYCTI